MKKIWMLLSLILFFTSTGVAQVKHQQKLRVFIDCSNTGCDYDYIKTEINLVDFLRNKDAADVHVLITSQRAGSGGSEYQMIFYGQHDFKNYSDTLIFTTEAVATDAEKRENLVHFLMLGLSPLIAKTPFASLVSVSMRAGEQNFSSLAPTKDKWNYWVFKPEINANFNYDKVYRSAHISSNFSVNRTTNDLKLFFNAYGNLDNSVYEYEDDSSVTTKLKVQNHNYGFYHSLVKTINKHWSYGYKANVFNKTFSNLKRKIYWNPALEYNIYRYQDVNNRFFVLRYGLDVSSNKYYDTTVLDKLSETLYGQVFSGAVTFNQQWGTFNSGFYFHNFFQNFHLNTFSLYLDLEMRLTGALSVNVYASGSIVHDQINLPRGEVSAQDVLSRSRQVGSTYNFNSALGISYRFGSVLNNFVNPRFEGYAGF